MSMTVIRAGAGTAVAECLQARIGSVKYSTSQCLHLTPFTRRMERDGRLRTSSTLVFFAGLPLCQQAPLDFPRGEIVMRWLGDERALTPGERAKLPAVLSQLGQRHVRANERRAARCRRIDADDPGAPRLEIGRHVADMGVGHA